MMVGEDDIRFGDYLSIFPEARTALEYGEEGLAHFALGELDRVRRKTFSQGGGGIEVFIDEAERRICERGVNIFLTLASQERRKQDPRVASFYVMQAREFGKRVGIKIEDLASPELMALERLPEHKSSLK